MTSTFDFLIQKFKEVSVIENNKHDLVNVME
jgi:hypothetical protein